MAVYDRSTLGTTANQIVFNDDSQSTFFRLRMRYPYKRNIRSYDIPLPENMGIVDFQTLLGETDYILQGTMYPSDDAGYDNGKQALRKVASLAIEQNDSSSDSGYVPYDITDNNGYNKRLMVKVLYVDLREDSRNGLKLPFVFYCKVKFPVLYSTSVMAGIMTIGAGAFATGGATIPATIPAAIGSSASGTTSLPTTLPVVFGATPGSSSVSLTNVGDLSSYPTITFQGPVSNPKIVNGSTGEFLQLSLILGSASDSVIASYDQDNVSITQSGISVYDKLTSDSTLFTIRPGTSVFSFYGSSTGVGAQANIAFSATWPLS